MSSLLTHLARGGRGRGGQLLTTPGWAAQLLTTYLLLTHLARGGPWPQARVEDLLRLARGRYDAAERTWLGLGVGVGVGVGLGLGLG